MGKKRITGNDRALMMLCHAARKYWRFYSPAYKETKEASICNKCAKHVDFVEIDHIEAIGPRPRTTDEFGPWLERLLYSAVQGLCKKHHKEKTKNDRKRRMSQSKSGS